MKLEVSGDRAVEAHFDSATPRLRSLLRAKIEELVSEAYALVKGDAPKGKTGKLEASIRKEVFENARRIVGRVFVAEDWAKAGLLEYGGRGKSFEVSGHPMALDHVFADRLTSPTMVFVSAHSSARNDIAKHFLRGPADAMRSIALEQLQSAVDELTEF